MKTKITLEQKEIEEAIVFWLAGVHRISVKVKKDYLDKKTSQPSIAWTTGGGGPIGCVVDAEEIKKQKKEEDFFDEHEYHADPNRG